LQRFTLTNAFEIKETIYQQIALYNAKNFQYNLLNNNSNNP